MKKESAYPNPRNLGPPGQTGGPQIGVPEYDTSAPKPPGIMDTFLGGYESAFRYKRKPSINVQEWADLKLTPRAWMDKYFHNGDRQAAWEAYNNWRKSVQQRERSNGNWFQRLTQPLKYSPQNNRQYDGQNNRRYDRYSPR